MSSSSNVAGRYASECSEENVKSVEGSSSQLFVVTYYQA
jgi:hypothetical protein